MNNTIISIVLFVMMAVSVADRFNMFDVFKYKKLVTKYLAISVHKTEDLNKTLNDSSNDGWEVAAVYQDKIIFKKNAKK